MRDATPLIFTTIITSLFLVLLIILVLGRIKLLSLRLILIGVFMAIAAALQGNISAVSIDSGQVAVSLGLAASSLLKIATILVLSGVAFAVLERTEPAPTVGTKEVSHG